MEIYSSKTKSDQQLSAAFLVYGSFATVHDVDLRDGRPVLLPGSPASKEGLIKALRCILPPEDRGTGLIPETMLAQGVGHMVWWVKPSTRTLWFSCKEIGGERSATVPLPGLVMTTVGAEWKVFAVKGKQRPSTETKLFQAPFFNVWGRRQNLHRYRKGSRRGSSFVSGSVGKGIFRVLFHASEHSCRWAASQRQKP